MSYYEKRVDVVKHEIVKAAWIKGWDLAKDYEKQTVLAMNILTALDAFDNGFPERNDD